MEPGPAAGVVMEHSCTVGNCGTCMVRLRHGQITQAEPNCLTEQQKASQSDELVRFSPRSGEVAEVPGRGLAVGEAGDQGRRPSGRR
ncbi:2Fe-2S iron-sulfur cluster binding domain-containing protein [Streptomyces sp. S9]|nr:2Fe-2S iron-sulfur cluster binding domain-containing protein [Streptomyces sp. S9]